MKVLEQVAANEADEWVSVGIQAVYANAVEMWCKLVFFSPLKCTEPLSVVSNDQADVLARRVCSFGQCTGTSCAWGADLWSVWGKHKKRIIKHIHTMPPLGWSTLGLLKMSLAVNWERITGVLACHYVHQTYLLPLPAFNSNSYRNHASALQFVEHCEWYFWCGHNRFNLSLCWTHYADLTETLTCE